MPDNSQRDEKLMTLIAGALARGGDERTRYLAEACRNDAALLREAGEAVEWEERMGAFLRTPAIALKEPASRVEAPLTFAAKLRRLFFRAVRAR